MRISDWSSDVCSSDLMVIAIDEFWKALADPAFTAFAQDGLKTYRKRNAFLVFATQSPADALRSTISHSILEQVATKIFLPNPFGQRRDYIEGFSLSEAEFKLVREELSPESRKFLVKQGHDRSEEHTSELQSLMRISYAVFCLKKKQIDA